ncbi:hypothetical protein E2C01_038981 [Portunus trituberculatus]|uniref:Uncharacterized protein n=1 Tax=Portunus trituberculatus TaxID=210409 RepID=A0A5B7FIM3_PORTR|nr:hypothetical protein [Portunus trituberculatus]
MDDVIRNTHDSKLVRPCLSYDNNTGREMSAHLDRDLIWIRSAINECTAAAAQIKTITLGHVSSRCTPMTRLTRSCRTHVCCSSVTVLHVSKALICALWEERVKRVEFFDFVDCCCSTFPPLLTSGVVSDGISVATAASSGFLLEGPGMPRGRHGIKVRVLAVPGLEDAVRTCEGKRDMQV